MIESRLLRYPTPNYTRQTHTFKLALQFHLGLVCATEMVYAAGNTYTHIAGFFSPLWLSIWVSCAQASERMRDVVLWGHLYLEVACLFVFPWLVGWCVVRRVYYDRFGTGAASSSEVGEDGCGADEGDPSAARICYRRAPRRGPRANDPDRRDTAGNQWQAINVDTSLCK